MMPSLSPSDLRASTPTFIDPSDGAPHPITELVDWFGRVWADPRAHDYRFLDRLSPEIRLTAPLAGSTRGRSAGYAAFRRTFFIFPDLSASVSDWAFARDVLMIRMRFRATIGARPFEWENIDRFQLVDGLAVERRAYFDPLPLVAATMRSPTALTRFVRARFGPPIDHWPNAALTASAI